MTQQGFIKCRDSYKIRTAIVALIAIVAILFSVGFVFRHTNGGELLFGFLCCVVIPLVGYGLYARYLAKQMGLVCPKCGHRILSSDRCRHCGGGL